ncbi:MAG TPA: TMEM14 family protein [Isosphaeraceae bacterium]
MNPRVGLVVLIIYAVLLIVGGVIGFLKARSKASLIAGVVSGIVAIIAVVISATYNEDGGYSLALLLATVLFVFFGYRASLSRKFMPGGLLAVASVVVIAVMVWSIVV